MNIFRETAERLMRAGAVPARIHFGTRSPPYRLMAMTFAAASVLNGMLICAVMLAADVRITSDDNVRLANQIRAIEPTADTIASADWRLRLSAPIEALRVAAPFVGVPEGARRTTPLAPLANEHQANLPPSRRQAFAELAELLASAPEHEKADVTDVAIEVVHAVFDPGTRRLLGAVAHLPRRSRESLAAVEDLPEILDRIAQSSASTLHATAAFGLRAAPEDADVRDLMEAVPGLDPVTIRALQRFRHAEQPQRLALAWILEQLNDQDPWMGRMLAAAFAGNSSLRHAIEQLPQACSFMNARACVSQDRGEQGFDRRMR